MHDVTLDQARALDAIDRKGTFAAAAADLRRGHTSVLYLIRTLEDALGFAVLDRSGYRTTLSARGKRVLEGCRVLLAAEADLATTIDELKAGWEPEVTVVFDGIVPIEPLLRAVGQLVGDRVPTRIDVRAEFLAGVEDTFERTRAAFMIAVLPPQTSGLTARDAAVFRDERTGTIAIREAATGAWDVHLKIFDPSGRTMIARGSIAADGSTSWLHLTPFGMMRR